MHLCLSGNPECSGCSPCHACFEFIKQRVVVPSMLRVGGPFTDGNAPWPAMFLQSFVSSWRHAFHTEAMPALKEKQTLNAAEEPKAQVDAPAVPDEDKEASPEEKKAKAQIEPIQDNDDPETIGYEMSPESINSVMQMLRNQPSESTETEKKEEPNGQEDR